MARRTKEEILGEFHRLYDFFDIACDIISSIDAFGHNGRRLAGPREEMLLWLDDGKATASQILSGLQQALNDLALGIDAPDHPASVEFAKRFRERTGRDFLDAIGRPSTSIKKILKRGRIVNETEYYLLNEILSQTDQTALSPDEVIRADTILGQFNSRPSQ
jgi:hypothetical protein